MISHHRLALLCAAALLGYGGSALAQTDARVRPPPAPHSSQLLPRPGDQPRRPPPRAGNQPQSGTPNTMGGLINYMDRTPVETEEEINSPVTGYGNEALWEYSDKRGPR